ncbi:pentatricopeptide repeat-containing protein At4g35130, chloroplastic-like [Selaginella moellendorffii]|nr:pentatricopeptide repeat-containing protein At4g35130, chloroplastic-like [Selaginella moellendorffii]|eukprot:XP_024530694.1 pentatricopeptide repeat-containing protein At4g35130, chloroplastic-like [Selaginella moellendorffii]
MQKFQKSSCHSRDTCAAIAHEYHWGKNSAKISNVELKLKQLVAKTLGSRPVTRVSYGSLLQACGEAKILAYGRVVHEHMSAANMDTGSIFLGNHLVQMYGRCGSVDEAAAAFERMGRRNVVSWSFVIAAFTQNGHHGRAMRFFQRMLQDGFEVDRILIVTALGSCMDLKTGREIHELALECGYGNETVVCTALLGMYSRCESLGDVETVFLGLQEKDVVSWNAMITAFVELGKKQSGVSTKVVWMFRRMLLEGMKPSRVTFISTLGAVESKEECVWLHEIIRQSGQEHDEFVANSLVTAYGKKNSIVNARQAFDAASDACVGTWNAMIAAYAHCGDFGKALETFMSMLESTTKPDQISFVNVLEAITGPELLKDGEFIHNSVVENGFEKDGIIGSALLGMYSRCENLEKAEEVFAKIGRPYHSVVAWNSMLATYTAFGRCKEAIKLFMDMQQDGSKATEATFATLLTACAGASTLAQGKMVVSWINEWLMSHTISACSYLVIQNATINMYAKCGSLDLALQTFNSMHQRDVTSWNSVLGTLARHGVGKEAVIFLKRMHLEGVRPDDITYTLVLTACSHHGLFKDGRKCYEFMTKVHGLEPTLVHYGCMVDLLGRGGWLDEAEDLIREMPMPADSTVWMALLGASRMHGDLARAKLAMKHVCELEPDNPSPYLLMSNIS